MLVAPLMSPILGLSLASVAGRQRMFEKAILALIEGVALSILLSFLIGLVAKFLPFINLSILPSEVLSRTKPTPFDLGIALAGGAAAAYALVLLYKIPMSHWAPVSYSLPTWLPYPLLASWFLQA
jgi:uncharacterized membrane protein